MTKERIEELLSEASDTQCGPEIDANEFISLCNLALTGLAAVPSDFTQEEFLSGVQSRQQKKAEENNEHYDTFW